MNSDVRFIEKPSQWATAPKYMSFSALKIIESCPLKWALKNAQYADLWSGKGYPTKTSTAAIVGQVIHGAVESVVKEAKKSTKGTLRTRMIQAVRKCGGFSILIDTVLADVLKEYAENPRMAPTLVQYQHGRIVLSPTVRTSIQSLLRKVSETAIGVAESTTARSSQGESTVKALSNGLYTEMSLFASRKNWFGKVDLLGIDGDNVVIEDIKTGKEKDTDREQVLTYAWLWWRDETRNPKGRLATRLYIQYLDSYTEIPVPDEIEWLKFEQELMERTSAARAHIPEESCEARPHVDNCGHCEVRQLCDAYWGDIVAGGPEINKYGDAEVELSGVLSSKTWQVKVKHGSVFAAGSTVLLRGALPDKPAAVGSNIRLLDVMFVQSSTDQVSEDTPTIQLLTQSEVFVRQAPVESMT